MNTVPGGGEPARDDDTGDHDRCDPTEGWLLAGTPWPPHPAQLIAERKRRLGALAETERRAAAESLEAADKAEAVAFGLDTRVATARARALRALLDAELEALPSTAAPSVRANVVVADDDRDVADSTAGYLSLVGYDARAAVSADELLDVVVRTPPDAIVVDLSLCGDGRTDLVARLRATPGLAGAAIIAMGGMAATEAGRDALRAGADFYVLKPVPPKLLVRLIDRVVRRRAGVAIARRQAHSPRDK